MRKLRVLCFILGIVSLGLFLSIRNRENTYNEIASKVLRLHVIGNSDSIQDQRLKMEVKKDIEDYLKNLDLDGGSGSAYGACGGLLIL